MTDLDDGPLHRIWLARLQVGLRHVLEHGGADDEALLPFWGSTVQEMFSGELGDEASTNSWSGLSAEQRIEVMEGSVFSFGNYVDEIKQAIEAALSELTGDDEGFD